MKIHSRTIVSIIGIYQQFWLKGIQQQARPSLTGHFTENCWVFMPRLDTAGQPG